MSELTLTLSEDALETLAQRVAAILSEEQQSSGDGWLRGADEIAAYIGAPSSRVYSLSSANRIPVHRDGSALVAKRSELDAWMLSGGGKRP